MLRGDSTDFRSNAIHAPGLSVAPLATETTTAVNGYCLRASEDDEIYRLTEQGVEQHREASSNEPPLL